MLVYGGYQFPFQSHYARDDEGGSGESGSGQGVEFEGSSEEGEETERDRVEVLRYHLASQSWDVLTTFPSFENVTSEDGNSTTTREKQPQLRYGHTSIVYNVSIDVCMLVDIYFPKLEDVVLALASMYYCECSVLEMGILKLPSMCMITNIVP